jgi:hypothetical protein
MRTLVVMPMTAYRTLRPMCNAGSPEYSLLKTAVILRHNGSEDVNLFCDNADAQSLVDFASRRCPQLASQIKVTADCSYWESPLPSSVVVVSYADKEP